MLTNKNQDWNKYWENINTNFQTIVEPRLNIESVYGDYPFEKLEKNSHNWKGCCPFHEDKSPSFVIYSENLQYHCFGCQEHGTPQKFLTKTKNISRKEALVELARKANVDESYLFGKQRTPNNLILDQSTQLKKIRTSGIENEIKLESTKWNSITNETSSLYHRINLLEQSASRIIEMEKIRLNEIDKIRELSSLLKTKLNENKTIDHDDDSLVRMYKFKLDQNTTLKCKYEIIFHDNNIERINESSWIEKESKDKFKEITNEEHSSYHFNDNEFVKTPMDINNNENFIMERILTSSNPLNNLNLKIDDIKDIGNQIRNRSEKINKIVAEELYDLIDTSLKIPPQDLENIIHSINENNNFNKIHIKLPENNKIIIRNIMDEKTLEKTVSFIQDNFEKTLFQEKFEKTQDGTWRELKENNKSSSQLENLTDSQIKMITTLSNVNDAFKLNLYSDSNDACDARSYLYKRGLTDEDITRWELGYVSPNLISKGIQEKIYNREELQSTGLVSEHGKEHFFGNRITFPIKSADGVILGFSAREIFSKNEDIPKYINSKSTELFQKGKILYGFDKAKECILETNNTVVTEGFMDAIQMQKHGFENTVAVMGT